MKLLSINKNFRLAIYTAITLGITYHLIAETETSHIPFSMKEKINAYKQKSEQYIPPGKYVGRTIFNGLEVKVSYDFDGTFVTKTITRYFEQPQIVTDKTRYTIEGSTLIFEDTGRGVFKTFPVPFEINQNAKRFSLVGPVPLRDFFCDC